MVKKSFLDVIDILLKGQRKANLKDFITFKKTLEDAIDIRIDTLKIPENKLILQLANFLESKEYKYNDVLAIFLESYELTDEVKNILIEIKNYLKGDN